MKKTLVVLAAAALVAGLTAMPASAGKSKHVHGTFEAQLLPFPKLAAWGDVVGMTKPGCSAGQENVHWVGKEFKAPGTGSLRLYMEGFTGDHDIYVFKGELAIAKGEGAQYDGSAPAEEEVVVPLKKGQKVLLVACNWLGGPEVAAHYEGHFKV